LLSRQAKFDATVQRKRASGAGDEAVGKITTPSDGGDIAAARVTAWKSTGIVGLRRLGLTEIPEDAFLETEGSAGDARTVRVLDISSNRITSLPLGIRKWTGLVKLSCAGNALTTESIDWRAFESLVHLRTLHLDDNALAGVLPDVLAVGLPKLEVLTLDRNRVTEFPSPSSAHAIAETDAAAVKNENTRNARFPALTRVSFVGNEIAFLPAYLASCIWLERIDGSGNRLTAIPEALARSPRLRELVLNDNKRLDVAGVPTNLLRLSKSLDKLSLHGCAVEMEALRELDGWREYDARRKKRAGKVIDSKVLLGTGSAFDEGADVERRTRH
jgi:Leucine-rich repeat (LRR) protein